MIFMIWLIDGQKVSNHDQERIYDICDGVKNILSERWIDAE